MERASLLLAGRKRALQRYDDDEMGVISVSHAAKRANVLFGADEDPRVVAAVEAALDGSPTGGLSSFASLASPPGWRVHASAALGAPQPFPSLDGGGGVGAFALRSLGGSDGASHMGGGGHPRTGGEADGGGAGGAASVSRDGGPLSGAEAPAPSARELRLADEGRLLKRAVTILSSRLESAASECAALRAQSCAADRERAALQEQVAAAENANKMLVELVRREQGLRFAAEVHLRVALDATSRER